MGKIKYLGATITWKPEPLTRAKTFCFTNIKGGVGKSTSAQALCEALAYAGFKVLAVDLDIQSNFSNSADAIMPNEKISLRELLDIQGRGETLSKEIVKKAIGKTNGNYDIIRCDLDIIMTERIYGGDSCARMFLNNILEQIRDEYHYIVIDTQPNIFSYITMCAYCAADELLIPAQANVSSAEGLDFVKQLYLEIKNNYNKNLSIRGLFYTMVESSATQRNVMQELQAIAEELEIPLLRTYIKRSQIYDSLKYKERSLMPQLIKNVNMVQYLILTNEITQKPIYKLNVEEV